MKIKQGRTLLPVSSLSRTTTILPNRGRRVLTGAVIFCSIFVQIAFLLMLPSSSLKNSSSDYDTYYSVVAQNIINRKSLIDSAGKFAIAYPPGFPTYIAAAYYVCDALHIDRLDGIRAFNVALMSLGCALIFLTAGNIFNVRIGLLSAVLWITYPFSLWLMKQPNSEVPFMPLLYGAVYFVVLTIQRSSWKYAIVSGLMFAAGALCRPIVLLLAVILAVAILLNKRTRWKPRAVCATALILAYLFCLMPWEITVYAKTRLIVPLSTGGASSMVDGVTFLRRTKDSSVPVPVAKLMMGIWGHNQQMHSNSSLVRYVASQLVQHPTAVIELVVVKFARCWYGTDSGSHEDTILVIQCLYAALCCTGIGFIAARFPNRKYFLFIFLTIVCYFWLMAFTALPIVRYLVPAIAYLLMFGAVTLDVLLSSAFAYLRFKAQANRTIAVN